MSSLFVQGPLDFSQATKLTADASQYTYGQLNSIMFYNDVYTDPITGQKVDALVTFYDSKNAYIETFDNPTLQFDKPNYIQPSVSFYGQYYPNYTTNTSESSISYNIQFIEDGSLNVQGILDRSKVSVTDTKQLLYNGSSFYNNITLKNLTLDLYNIAGSTQYVYNVNGDVTNSWSTTSRNFVEISQSDVQNVKTYPDSSTSELSVSTLGTNTRIQSTTGGYQTSPSGTSSFDQHRATVYMNDVNSLNIKMGDASVRNTNYARFSLSFGANLDPITRFFVPDSTVNKMFEYSPIGAYKTNWSLDSNVRDVAASPDGSKLWTIDTNKQINVYDSNGMIKGSWKTNVGTNPEGVAYDNFNGTNSIWVADDKGKIQWYFNSGNYTTGTFSANSSFSINVGKGNKLKGIVSDSENNLWVVIDGSDQIRKYTINRSGNTPTGLTLKGTWNLPEMGTSTGITLDVKQSSSSGNIWVVIDGQQDKVLNYSGLRGASSGMIPTPYTESILTSTNANPQGIAEFTSAFPTSSVTL